MLKISKSAKLLAKMKNVSPLLWKKLNGRFGQACIFFLSGQLLHMAACLVFLMPPECPRSLFQLTGSSLHLCLIHHLFKSSSPYPISVAAFCIFVHIVLFTKLPHIFNAFFLYFIMFKFLIILNMLTVLSDGSIISSFGGDKIPAVYFLCSLAQVGGFLLPFVILACEFTGSRVPSAEILHDLGLVHILLKLFCV